MSAATATNCPACGNYCVEDGGCPLYRASGAPDAGLRWAELAHLGAPERERQRALSAYLGTERRTRELARFVVTVDDNDKSTWPPAGRTVRGWTSSCVEQLHFTEIDITWDGSGKPREAGLYYWRRIGVLEETK